MQKEKQPKAAYRLGGGPEVEKVTKKYFDDQATRAARELGQKKCSVGSLLNRICTADIDLTLKGLAEYKEFRESRAQKKRPDQLKVIAS